MNTVAIEPKFQDSISEDSGMSINLQEGDIMEDFRVGDRILHRVKQVADRKAIADRIASMLADVHIPPEDLRRSEDEIMEVAIAEISASRRERRDNEI